MFVHTVRRAGFAVLVGFGLALVAGSFAAALPAAALSSQTCAERASSSLCDADTDRIVDVIERQVCGTATCANTARFVTNSAGTTIDQAADASSSFAAGTDLLPYYPANDGFSKTPSSITLNPGTTVDRYGAATGRFVSPAGTPAWQRALPYGAESDPVSTYTVLKPIDVLAGEAAPWFGQPGGGIQYLLPSRANELLRTGHLEGMR